MDGPANHCETPSSARSSCATPERRRVESAPCAWRRCATTHKGAPAIAEPVPPGSDGSAGPYEAPTALTSYRPDRQSTPDHAPAATNGRWSTRTGGDSRDDPYLNRSKWPRACERLLSSVSAQQSKASLRRRTRRPSLTTTASTPISKTVEWSAYPHKRISSF